MRLLFVYNGPLILDAKGNYYSRTINDEVLSRYFELADEVTMLTRVKKTSDSEKLKKLSKITHKNFNVIESENISSLKGITKRPMVKKSIQNAVKNSDIAIVRLPSLIGNIAVDFLKKFQKNYLIEVVGCPWDAYWNHSLKGKALAPIMWSSTRTAIRSAPLSLYVTNEFLQNRYPTKGRSIGCSDVVLHDTDKQSIANRIHKIQSKKNPKSLVLGTTAAIDIKYKGQEYVIRAIKELKRKGYSIEYRVVGGGNERRLKNLARKLGVENEVKFMGMLPHKDIFKYLDTIDIYIQPSKQEGLPRALVEAMSRGCPAIGARTGGIPELLGEEVIFKKGSVKELISIIQSFDKDKMMDLSKENFEKAGHFTKDKNNEKRRDFYSLLINESR